MNPRLGIALLILCIVIYGMVRAIPLISGPHIVLTSPEAGQKYTDGFVTVSGSLVHAQNVSLDGMPLLTDEHGNFSSTITLPPGNSILTITAQDRFGRHASEERTVYIP